MRTMVVFVAVFMLGLVLTPAAEAGCWACGQNSCCTEAAQGSTGRGSCAHNVICVGGNCACYYCNTAGGTCDGTAPPTCTKPLGNCEENQTMRVVPNGEPLDLDLLIAPPLSWSADTGTPAGGEACGAT